MLITSFNEKTYNPIVLCLGGFDSVHIGHKKLIDYANEIKLKYNASSAVFSYKNDFGVISGKQKGLVFTYEERLVRFEKIGVDELCVADFTLEFSNYSPDEFLRKLCDNRLIATLICGKDFRFGKNALGNVNYLQNFCAKKNIPLHVCDFEIDEEGNKISTSAIKENLILGKIENVNKLLGDEYFISGIVKKGRQQGRTLGFPTANLQIPKDKFPLKPGVYSTYVIINGVRMNALTNVGNAPTFNYNECLLECHIVGFNGDLYGKELTVYFKSYMRGIKKFDSIELLKKQLETDLEVIK